MQQPASNVPPKPVDIFVDDEALKEQEAAARAATVSVVLAGLAIHSPWLELLPSAFPYVNSRRINKHNLPFLHCKNRLNPVSCCLWFIRRNRNLLSNQMIHKR